MKDTLKAKETYQFRTHKTYSAEEILAAGGTSAFARKMGVKITYGLPQRLLFWVWSFTLRTAILTISTKFF